MPENQAFFAYTVTIPESSSLFFPFVFFSYTILLFPDINFLVTGSG